MIRTKLRKSAINEVDVVILLGDSRQVGQTAPEVSLDPKYITTGYPKVKIGWKPDRLSTINTSIEAYSNRSPTWNRYPGAGARETGPSYFVGPDVSLAYQLNNRSGKTPIILKWSRGGSSLLTNTVDVNNDWQNVDLHRMFEFLNYYLPQSLNQIYQQGYGKLNFKINVSLGTNDLIYVWNESAFKSALPIFISQIRTAISDNLAPVSFVLPDSNLYLETSVLPAPSQANVNACRQDITDLTTLGNAAYIPNVSIIDVSDLPLLADGLHKNQEGCLAQGDRVFTVVN